MPLDFRLPSLASAFTRWQLVRDTLAGELAIKAAKCRYLPKLEGQTDEQYAAYQFRAVWLGATAATQAAFTGLICGRSPEIQFPESRKQWLDNVDGCGSPLSTFIQDVVGEMDSVSWYGTLIDWTEQRTPRFINYPAESIWNLQTAVINGQVVLSMLTLREWDSEWDGATGHPRPDEYSTCHYEQYRQFFLRGRDNDRFVEVVVSRPKMDEQNTMGGDVERRERTFVELTRTRLVIGGAPVREIPFVLHSGSTGSRFTPPKPVLEDIASLNVKHYAQSADLENGRHVAGIPTPWAAGFASETDKGKLTLGANAAWVSDSPEAKCGFLEFAGAGLSSLSDGLKEKEAQMASLGARALTPTKEAAEAYATVHLRQKTEAATLVTISEQASLSISLCLSWAAYIMDGIASEARKDWEKKAYCVLNKDLTVSTLDSATLQTLFAMWQQGGLSYEAYFNLLLSKQVFPDAWTMEKEKAAMEQAPIKPPVPDTPPTPPAQ